MASLSGARPAKPKSSAAAVQVDRIASPDVLRFYAARQQRPLWLGAGAGDAAQQLLRLLNTADVDGISRKFDVGALLVGVQKASGGDPAAVRRAELALSEAFVAYARDLQHDPRIGVIYVDAQLKPKPSAPAEILSAAAKAPSLSRYVGELGWMNPLYGQVRAALAGGRHANEADRHRLKLNLDRARALPAATARYVIVNTANQRLYMYENGKVVDQMKVVAGRPTAQTPLMNAFIRFAVLNPYWNVPTDLVARLAPKVLARGSAYLREQGYEVVANFTDREAINPTTVDWKAVSSGKLALNMRQLPGPANSMGRVKFMFPNPQGVWLHDTPSREHFAKQVRLESAGCVRLEDAWRLGSWLFRRPLQPQRGAPEQRADLQDPVPIYITYLTAVPEGSVVTLIEDVYRRDLLPLA